MWGLRDPFERVSLTVYYYRYLPVQVVMSVGVPSVFMGSDDINRVRRVVLNMSKERPLLDERMVPILR